MFAYEEPDEPKDASPKPQANEGKLNELLELLENPSSKDVALIKKAYTFAKKAHSGQKRYSGEPYFNHVFETGKVLARLGMGAQTISAGLLHDSLEDAHVSEEVLNKEFGSDILFLIQGVTKLGRIRYQGAKRHIESLRKLFVATSQDLRVLIIKLADRLHNMRTLNYVPERKQERIAQETMEVYAPIADRLNIGLIQAELQDLAFPYLNPKEFESTRKLAKPKYEESVRELKKISKTLDTALKKEKIYDVRVSYRMKHLYSLYQKLIRKDMDIDRVYDITALRVIVPSISDCYRVLGIIHSIWRPLPGRIKDYIAFPKPNGYQSIHTTIFTGDGGIAEIQIRTERMHREAEYGVASHFDYKKDSKEPGAKSTMSISWFRHLLSALYPLTPNTNSISDGDNIPNWVKELAEAQKEAREDEFMDNLKFDFFSNRIFVFTPNGDVIDLPIGSCPVDFAYHIHSDIGNTLSGAKVNAKMASLDTQLQNGDIVEIITKKNGIPNKKWLEFVKTTVARRHIKSTLSKEKQQS